MGIGFFKVSERPEHVQWTEESRFAVHKSAHDTATSGQIQRTQHSGAAAVGSSAANQQAS